MQYVILGALAAAILYGAVQLYAYLDTRLLLRLTRFAVGIVLVVVGVGLTFARQVQFGVPAIFLGLITLFRGRLGPFDFGAGSRSAGQTSKVRARYVEASLDHDSGELSGKVTEGRYSGLNLTDLNREELQDLQLEVSIDPDSLALVEAYLDRRFPGWRDDVDQDGDAGSGGASNSGTMTDEEAYEILGLPPGATVDEISAAHRRLLKGVHPDQGGSTFLAARINQAKDRLLGKHG
jgi:hypothetical protein